MGGSKLSKNEFSGISVDTEELIAVILEKAPSMYSSILATEERAQKTGLTLQHLEEAMKVQYRIHFSGEFSEKKTRMKYPFSTQKTQYAIFVKRKATKPTKTRERH